ncbi:MAG: YkgJ family cysteine cluster protein [Candidatus Bruticola sp.]
MTERKISSVDTAAPESSSEGEWYANGLRFTCQRCGRCCSGPSGIVQCTREEAEAMLKELNMEWPEFLNSVACEYEGQLYLKEVRCKYGFDCVLLERNEKNKRTPTGCMVRNSRPVQCRTWPFWPEVIYSPQTWSLASKRCPGIGVGELHSAEEIRNKAALTSDPVGMPPEEMSRAARLQRGSSKRS